MAKVTFEFDMHEDKDELRIFQHVDQMYFALDHIYSLCRNRLNGEEMPEDIASLLREISSEALLVHRLDG